MPNPDPNPDKQGAKVIRLNVETVQIKKKYSNLASKMVYSNNEIHSGYLSLQVCQDE